MMFSSEFGFEVPTVAEFSDNVAISIGCKNFMALKDIRVTKLLKNINLGKQ